jgi:hypothetical protein
MNKVIRISNSPFTINLEVFEDIVIKLHVPYSDKSVTVMVNPNIQEYQENKDRGNVKVRQLLVTIPTDDTRVLSFDFERNKKHRITIADHNYEIELISIGKENIQGQDFPYYEFNVSSG